MAHDAPSVRTVVVTGAAQGIGRAIAERFASSGCSVALVDRDEAAVVALADELNERGPKAASWCADVTGDNPALLLHEVASTLGMPSVLVNNAGIIDLGPALETTRGGFRQVFAVNVEGTFFWSQAFAQLVERDAVIVNMASQLASRGGVNRVSYAASKAAVVQMTKALAVEWADRRIRVNAVAPGPTRTAMTQTRLAETAAAQQLLARIPFGEPAEPDDVAAAVSFLASDEAGYVTGAVLAVDGGYTAG